MITKSKVPCLRAFGMCLQKTSPRVHLAYFAAVWTEAHGFYAMAAGSCLIVGLLGELVKEPTA